MPPARSLLARAIRAARRLIVTACGLPWPSGPVDAPSSEVARDIVVLWINNLTAGRRRRVVDPSVPVAVSLTTHGPRVRDVWMVVESIARGRVRPGRIVIWLDEGTSVPWRLRRLRTRGLEIREGDARLRSYKKFWPYLESADLHVPLVIADDDVIYSHDWLRGLLQAHRESPDDVIAYRAHIIGLDDAGKLAPYSQWVSCDDDAASFANFATGVSGVLYPTSLQNELRAEGQEFMVVAPTADDVWLHRTAVRFGHRTRQVLKGQQHPPFIPGSQASGLNSANVAGGANDRQLAAAHTPETLARIAADIARREARADGSA